jgi:hypothetical protein
MSGTDDGVVSNEERRKVKKGQVGKLQTGYKMYLLLIRKWAALIKSKA